MQNSEARVGYAAKYPGSSEWELEMEWSSQEKWKGILYFDVRPKFLSTLQYC